MTNLVRAEMIKIRHSPFVGWLVFFSVALPLLLLLLECETSSPHPSSSVLWPQSGLLVANNFAGIAYVLCSTMMGWLVGLDQAEDTWKMILGAGANQRGQGSPPRRPASKALSRAKASILGGCERGLKTATQLAGMHRPRGCSG